MVSGVGDFKASRFSVGDMFGAYKGTRAILGRCVKAQAREYEEWLTRAILHAVLGDLNIK